MPARRSTASCCDRLDGSMSISARRSRTGFGPGCNSSRTRMRTGCPRVRNISALAWYNGTDTSVPQHGRPPTRLQESVVRLRWATWRRGGGCMIDGSMLCRRVQVGQSWRGNDLTAGGYLAAEHCSVVGLPAECRTDEHVVRHGHAVELRPHGQWYFFH